MHALTRRIARPGPKLASLVAMCTLGQLVTGAAAAQSVSPLSALLQVTVLDHELLAIDSEGGGETPERLELGERVLWTDARGRVGVAVTDRRMLAVATTSGSWQSVRYLSGETPPEEALIGDSVVLVLTAKRALGFDAENGVLREVRKDPQESWGKRAVGTNVAVVLSSRRALALAVGTGGFFAQKLRLDEPIESIDAFANHLTIRTPIRLLIFRGPTASWSERRTRLR